MATNRDDYAARLQQLYNQYLGRSASDAEINDWINRHPTFTGEVESGIANSDEAKTYATSHNTSVPEGATGWEIAPEGGINYTPTQPAGQTPNNMGDQAGARITQWYQQYMGRTPSDAEMRQWLPAGKTDLSGIEEGIAGSQEAKDYAAKTAPAAPAAPAGGTGTGGATPGYDPNKLRAALMASGVPANADELKKFIAAHPEFATGVTIGGSKGNKLYGPGGVYLADVIRGTSTANPAWDWDTSTGTSGGAAGGGGASGIDETYLGGYPGGGFEAPPGSEIPPAFEYEGFTPGEDTALPGEFSYEGFQSPGTFVTPDKAALENDPSYQFRKDQAMGALQNSASGRGLTNSGGTIYDLLGTSSQFASTEYGNVWDRQFKEWQDKYNTAKTTYDTNRGNAAENYALNLTGRQNAYDQALSKYTTGRSNALENWRTKYGVSKDIYDRARDEFDRSVKDYYDSRDSAWEKLYKTAGLGAGVTTAG